MDDPAALSPPLLIASDLDGTLLRSDGSVSPRTRDAWTAVAGAGIDTVLVTARPPRWLHDLGDLVGGHGIALCGNGAFVYDVPSRRVLGSHGFRREEILALAAELRDHVPGICFGAERVTGLYAEPGFVRAVPVPREPAPVSGVLEDMDEDVVGKLLARSAQLDPEEFLAQVTRIVGTRVNVAYSGAAGMAEMNPLGVTKATALQRWSDERRISSGRVWAFGDMPNDMPMLTWAGTAFAVANAHPDVLAAADHVCPANDDDGVAVVLEALLLRLRAGSDEAPPLRAAP